MEGWGQPVQPPLLPQLCAFCDYSIMRKLWIAILGFSLLLVLAFSTLSAFVSGVRSETGRQITFKPTCPDCSISVSLVSKIYLPLIQKPGKPIRQVNVPYFDGDIPLSETAIFWFGRVTPTENYADIRMGYNQEELYVRLAAFDRRLWYNKDPFAPDLETWDAVSLYLNIHPADSGDAPGADAYRFVGQLNWSEERGDWQTAYRGNGTNWVGIEVPFSTASGWRGSALNDDSDDRGWTITFRIPFSSLGLSAPPSQGTSWGLALALHDRDDAAGTPISDQIWPETMAVDSPKTWGQLLFGLPSYSPPSVNPGGTVTIRHGLNGANVVDAHVGGHTNCGGPFWPDFFNGWGDANYAGYDQINIQNQADVADWPCFSKYYVTFPLNAIPQGKVILSSKLKLFLFGNSGQGWQPAPRPSLIQVLLVKDDWNENTITWNNAPLAVQNVSQTWVYPVDEFPGYPGIPYEWDVSQATADAYESGEPLRLVLYSSDGAIHSGKYFYSSDVGEWNAEGRPTLTVVWGNRN
jgi:hypothetical protein